MGRSGLIEYLRECEVKPFSWGDRDCFRFANTCVELQRGHGFADDILARYSTQFGAAKWYNRITRTKGLWADMVDLLDDRLERVETLHPKFGMIVARDEPSMKPFKVALGLVLHGRACFLSPQGLAVLPLDNKDMYWAVT